LSELYRKINRGSEAEIMEERAKKIKLIK
jgi:hypothetical protein